MENGNGEQVHVMFLPFMAEGHIIPMAHMAKMFASRGAKVSIVTTEANNASCARALEPTDLPISLVTARFPVEDKKRGGLPTSDNSLALFFKFLMSLRTLRKPVEDIIRDLRPHCLVADMFFPWATESAAVFGIPRLVFHGTSFFSLCVEECLRKNRPQFHASSNDEMFDVPDLPVEGGLKLCNKQLSPLESTDVGDDAAVFFNDCKASWAACAGTIVNSVRELEPVYSSFFGNYTKGRSWHIGPLSLACREIDEKAAMEAAKATETATARVENGRHEHYCMQWLAARKKKKAVVYICFGSTTSLTSSQMMEIGEGIEASGQDFVWVVSEKTSQEWLPRGFAERTEGRGLVVQGWAPQVRILEHEAVGGFVTHCGWNSALEAIAAGVPMVTWPQMGDQFYNNALLTRIMKVGVPVVDTMEGARVGDVVSSHIIATAIKRIMEGNEARELSERAINLAKMTKNAIQSGGSSCSSLEALIGTLRRRN